VVPNANAELTRASAKFYASDELILRGAITATSRPA
jgi:hypothetical protein